MSLTHSLFTCVGIYVFAILGYVGRLWRESVVRGFRFFFRSLRLSYPVYTRSGHSQPDYFLQSLYGTYATISFRQDPEPDLWPLKQIE